MDQSVKDMIISILKKEPSEYFTSFEKTQFVDQLTGLRKEISQNFSSNLSYSQLNGSTNSTNLLNTSLNLNSLSRELISIFKAEFYETFSKKIEEAKTEYLDKLEGVIFKDYADDSTYFGKIDDNNKRSGLGYYSESDKSYLFYGNWENDFHKNGILLVKREALNEVFIGEFTITDEGQYSFKGLYVPTYSNLNESSNSKEHILAFSYGVFNQLHKEIDGISVFHSKVNTDLDIYLGKIANFKKSDSNAVLISFTNGNEISLYAGGFSNNHRSGNALLHVRDQFLLDLTYSSEGKVEKSEAVFLRLGDKSLFQGETVVEGEKKILVGNKGKILFKNNHIYTGSFENGKKEGKGEYLIRNEANETVFRYEGNFKADQIVTGTIFKGNRKIFEGEFDSQSQPFKGLYFYQNGEVYEGEFSNNNRNGKGKYVYADKCVYEGEWKSGMKNGSGRFVDKEGNVFEAIWSNNHLTKIEKCVPVNDEEK